MPGRREKLTICNGDNLVVVNLCPTLGSSKSEQTNCYQYFRTNPNAAAFKSLLDAVTSKLKLTQAGVVVDRIELLTSLLGPDETLKFVKLVKHTGPKPDGKPGECGLYPFVGHADFSMTTSHQQFDVRLQKLQNGLCRVEATKFNAKSGIFEAHLYTAVVKSGCRFVDEHCIAEKTGQAPFAHFKTNALGLTSNVDASLTEAS